MMSESFEDCSWEWDNPKNQLNGFQWPRSAKGTCFPQPRVKFIVFTGVLTYLDIIPLIQNLFRFAFGFY